MKHSCSLTAADPGNLLLELLPGHNAKTFKANKHSEWKKQVLKLEHIQQQIKLLAR